MREPFQDLKPVHPRHADIEEDEIGLEFIDGCHRLRAIAAFSNDPDPRDPLQILSQQRTGKRFVVDKDGGHGMIHGSGSVKDTSHPFPGRDRIFNPAALP